MEGSYKNLYAKLRPKNFEEIIGQKHVIKCLKNTVKFGRISHAYIFFGAYGTGKTTIARIFSKYVNCENPINENPCNECRICKGINNDEILDILEMDAASNNGVDNIRQINDEIKFKTMQSKYRFYIIDEAHMLSNGAWNALLKTLEEPPENVIFVLATTEHQKIPETILSRCQNFCFNKIKETEIFEYILKVSSEKKINITIEALKVISEFSDGSVRDALSNLELCMSYSDNITHKEVLELFSLVPNKDIFEIIENSRKKDLKRVLKIIYSLLDRGKEAKQIFDQILKFLDKVLNYKTCGDIDELHNKQNEEDEVYAYNKNQFKKLALCLTYEEIYDIVNILNDYYIARKWSYDLSLALINAFIKINSLNENLEKNLEKQEQDKTEKKNFALWEKVLKEIKSKSKKLFLILQGSSAIIKESEILIYPIKNSGVDKINTEKGKKYLSDLIFKISNEHFEVDFFCVNNVENYDHTDSEDIKTIIYQEANSKINENLSDELNDKTKIKNRDLTGNESLKHEKPIEIKNNENSKDSLNEIIKFKDKLLGIMTIEE